MIPTSIDGTDITGATIDGTDVTEITVDGDTVFTAGPAIVDDFEDQNLNEYSRTDTWTITTGQALSGSASLFCPEGDQSSKKIISQPQDGLPVYPQFGDTVQFDVKFTDQTTDPEPNNFTSFLYGVQTDANENFYVAFGTRENNLIEFLEVGLDSTGSSRNPLDSAPNDFLNTPSNQYRLQVTWDSTHTATLFDSNDNLLGSVSHTNQTYSSGGLGFVHQRAGGGGNTNGGDIIDDLIIL